MSGVGGVDMCLLLFVVASVAVADTDVCLLLLMRVG